MAEKNEGCCEPSACEGVRVSVKPTEKGVEIHIEAEEDSKARALKSVIALCKGSSSECCK